MPADPKDMHKEKAKSEAGNGSPDETANPPSEKTARKESRPEASAQSNPVRRLTLIVLSLCVVLLIWYLFADRFTPYTNQAKVQAFVVPIVPEISGTVIKVNAQQNRLLRGGEILLEIDTSRYQTAVVSAEAALESAGHEVGAGSAAVRTAEANRATALAKLDRAQRDYNRIRRLQQQDPGSVSGLAEDRSVTGLAQAKSEVAAAEAELAKAKEQLGREGQENAQFRSALAALEKARIDLADTTIRVPSDGLVTDLRIDVGQYAQAGKPLMTFLSITDIWVQADMRENNIANVKPGDPVEILLDIAPARIFAGEVASIGYGVGEGRKVSLGDLPTITESSGWLRDAQRFPVIIKFVDDASRGLRRAGGQADVIIYTGDHTLLNALGWLWIRLMSVLSYVY